MRNNALDLQQEEPLSPKAAALYKWAGRISIVICMLHFIFFTIVTLPNWGTWASGAGWGKVDPQTPSDFALVLDFWALPGSFMVPLFLLAMLIVRASRFKDRLPGYIGWGMLLWGLICSYILEPSGFPLVIIPSVLLILAQRK